MRRAATITAMALVVIGCWREQRELRDSPASSVRDTPVRLSGLQPGQPMATPQIKGAYEGNAYGITEGQRLYGWYNCAGCHFQGGGGIGPALMDDYWVYGSEPQQIYETIAEGRPNGMPSFGGHIPSDQIWKLVAYVRSLAKLQPPDAISVRSDHLAPQANDQPGSSGGKTRKQ
jgi:cytochrome c oxidase cbb3-type subunit III